ncbi:MAG: HDIG domain-containing protein [Pyrinomonadaceae bacterium]
MLKNIQPTELVELARAVAGRGGRAMLVGGCVRDELMGVAHKDWDVEVYGIDPARLREILDSIGDVNVVGEAFAVYKIGSDLDVSIPRRERKVSGGHRGFLVEGDPDMSFEEACSRRDFTVNAILRDVLTGEVIDPFNGQGDLRRKMLKMVSATTFPEDSLRALRAAQFAARFEFEIDAQTVDLCKTIDVTDLPKERIWGEMEKLLLLPQKPSIGLKWLYDFGVAKQLFPEMQALVGVPQEPAWHPEGDVDVHTLMVVDEARKLIDDLDHARKIAVMVGALAHDFGKPPTTEFVDGRIRSRGHDEAGVEPTLRFLDTLGIHTLDGYDVATRLFS